LSLHDVRPPCAPKEISDHMGHEHKKGRRDHRETDRGRPPHRFGHSAGKPPRGGENYGGDRPDQESSARRGFGGPRGQGRRGNQGGRRFRP
jgi:hypothetical protein